MLNDYVHTNEAFLEDQNRCGLLYKLKLWQIRANASPTRFIG